MAVAINLDASLDKAYENVSLGEVLAAPVSALAGVTEGDAELLKKAFNINTVGRPGQEQVLPGGPASRRTRRGRRQVGQPQGIDRLGQKARAALLVPIDPLRKYDCGRFLGSVTRA